MAASPAPSPDYSYSDANKKADITWSEATFKDYIQNPMAKVPGTKMAFAGIKNEKEIGDLWAYLEAVQGRRQQITCYYSIAYGKSARAVARGTFWRFGRHSGTVVRRSTPGE